LLGVLMVSLLGMKLVSEIEREKVMRIHHQRALILLCFQNSLLLP
jgi:hypothetical protein